MEMFLSVFGAGFFERMAEGDEVTLGVVASIILIVLVLLGVRVVYATAAVGLVGLVSMLGWTGGAGNAGMVPYAKGTIYSLSVLPMFILIGFLAYHAGMTEKLFDAAKKWFGFVPGGLAVATVFATAGFAAVSGASTATAAVFARVAIPEMLKYKYSPRLAAGVVAAGGTLASLIPPSAILVIYAIIVEESIGRLLVAGFIPGIVSALIYALLIIYMAWRNPKLGPAIKGFTWPERIKSVPGTFPVASVIVIIFFSMYTGWATPTEAGALGSFVVFIMALAGGMKWRTLREALLETARLTVMIFSLIWGVLIFVRFLGFVELPTMFAEWVTHLPMSPTMIMICILLFYVILGMFMDAIGMLLLTLPVVYPAVIALGYDPIWFGIVVVKMCEVCLITPPIGLNCYVVSGVRPDIPLQDVFRGIGPFFIADVITLGVFLAFPAVITWLPNLMMSG
ncbi:MAG: TRAP transporter large permease [Burkholderiaceae bacterium]